MLIQLQTACERTLGLPPSASLDPIMRDDRLSFDPSANCSPSFELRRSLLVLRRQRGRASLRRIAATLVLLSGYLIYELLRQRTRKERVREGTVLRTEVVAQTQPAAPQTRSSCGGPDWTSLVRDLEEEAPRSGRASLPIGNACEVRIRPH